MTDAHYFLYYAACFNDFSIPDDLFDQISFEDCYIYGKSTGNTKIKDLWNQMISSITKQWILFFSALERSDWFHEDLLCDKVILTFIFMPILRNEIQDWVEDHNTTSIWPQQHRSLHIAGISNDLYRNELPNAEKQGFNFDPDLHASLEAQVLAYGLSHL